LEKDAMKKAHTKKYFLAWHERKLSRSEMEAIEQHLKICTSCKNYFDKVQLVLGQPELSVIPELKADPFLPTRTREKVKLLRKEVPPMRLWRAYFRLTIGAAMIIIALVTGIFLGKWISGNEKISETEIVLSYSSIFSNQGVGEFWSDVVEKNGEQQ
jgi:predicted anti-sigma-YlaC factor YlaD